MSKINDSNISRRQFLRGLGIGAAGLAATACVGPAAAPGPAMTATTPAVQQPAAAAPASASATAATSFDWMSRKGQEVSYLGLKSGPEDFWEKLVPEIEQKTGLKVKFEAFDQAQSRQKLATEFTGGGSAIDTFRTTKSQDFAQYGKNGWYEPLDAYIKDASKTAPDFELSDFFEGAINSCTLNGKLVALPVINGGQCMFVRNDLLQAKGLKAPTTFDELEKVAKALHNPPDVYGFVSRGQKSASASMFAVFLHGFGIDWMGKDGKTPSINTPEAVEAYKFYGGLLRAYAPPGIINMANIELVPLFQQGQAALYPDDLSFRNQFEDATKSKVTGKVGYTRMPAGPKRNKPTIYVYGLSIASQSKRKDAAWMLIQYLASKDVQIRGMQIGVAAGRKSPWADAKAIGTAPADWLDTAKWTFDTGDDQWAPPVISVPEARDVITAPITVAIEGGDVKAACDKANVELTAIAKRDGIL